MQTDDQKYYQKREADERNAADKAEPSARRAHLDLAELYAARLRGEQVSQLNPTS